MDLNICWQLGPGGKWAITSKEVRGGLKKEKKTWVQSRLKDESLPIEYEFRWQNAITCICYIFILKTETRKKQMVLSCVLCCLWILHTAPKSTYVLFLPLKKTIKPRNNVEALQFLPDKLWSYTAASVSSSGRVALICGSDRKQKQEDQQWLKQKFLAG